MPGGPSYLSSMKKDLVDLVTLWGKNSTISRNVLTKLASGRFSGSFVSQATEVLWVQPVGGNSEVLEKGIDEETTHFAFQRFTGYSMQAKDRVLQSGDTLEYDVIRVHVLENHRVSELKQVRR